MRFLDSCVSGGDICSKERVRITFEHQTPGTVHAGTPDRQVAVDEQAARWLRWC
jgi:hypothetical protein